MPRGLMVRGGQFINPNMRVGRVVTQISTGTNDGSVPVNGGDQGKIEAVPLPIAGLGWAAMPRITATQSSVSWTFEGRPANTRQSAYILVVVY